MTNKQVKDHWRKKTSKHIWQPENRLVTSSRSLYFHNICEKRLGSKTKILLDPSKILDNALSKYLMFDKVSWMH